uniref:Uncharacterized protein n=1 Tax=Chromera velia CCMP2878 TaxID=1169474 RepID=A0A0G4FY51_9ALVE|eukprot:Cvel_19351.t1-p1 / transcript=Cvel_19351.t1 / gene=Cvel_19351 / organism=Chromera_velia_CCMP2878 / gene_product=hypothetical protein / transcript_product=hypothetical protein / location=Cvel_scaffold1662:476-6636(-) / protein_length=505 / sequence_SO=supercontig / SO=protein_coding / is_pseudo=false
MLQERHGVPTGLSSAPLDLPPRSVGPSLEETIASRAFKKAQEEAEAAAAHLGSCGVSLLPSDLIQRGKAASRRVSGAPTAFGALSRKARAGPRTRLVPLHGEGVGGLPHSASAALLPTSGSRPTSIPDDLHHSASAAHLGRPQAEGDVFSPSRTLGEGGVLGFGGGVKTECEGQTSTFMTSLPFGQGEVSTALLEESSASASYRGPVGGPESPSKRGAQSRDRGRDREGGGATLLPMKSVSSSNLPLQSIALSVSPSSSPSRSNRHGLPLPGRNFCRWMKYPRKRDNRDTKALEEATPGGSALVSLSAEMKRLSGGTGEAAYQRLKNRIGELHGRVGNLEKLMAFFDVDIDEDGSGFRVRSQAATIVQKRWRGFFARRKFLKLQSALERYRVRSFVHFGSAVMKWLEKRNHTDWVIKRWHQVCNEKAKKAVFKEKAVRQKLLNMSAHLVRTKAHLRSLSVHFDSWRRLATSRALQQASLGLKELKEKAFFIWSLSVRKKRQVSVV